MRPPSFTRKKGTILQGEPMGSETAYTIRFEDGTIDMLATADYAYRPGNVVIVDDNGIECYIQLFNEEAH